MELIFCGDASFKLQHDANEEKSRSILSDILPVLKSADSVSAGVELCHGKPIFYSLGNFIFKLSRYFDGWCVLKGGAYWANGSVKPEYTDVSSQPDNFAGYLDVFTCEAHHDLITCSLRMLFEGRYPEGLEYAEKVRDLQIKRADPLAFFA